MKPTPRWLYVSLLGVLLFIGSQVLFSPKDGLNEPPERQTDTLILLGGNTLRATIFPAEWKPTIYSVIVEKVIACESSGQHEGRWGDIKKKYPAYGIAQFQQRTFYWLAGLADMHLHWKNEADQLWLLDWAIENNWGKLWTCYNKLFVL